MAYNPTLNHLGIVQAVRGLYPNDRLTADQCAALCHEVARRCIAGGELDAGVMFKDSGNYGTVAGRNYSVDVILYRDAAVWVDCLRDAGDRTGGPGLAQPAWQGPQPGNTAHWAPPVGPTPEPPPPPGDLEARVEALEVAVADLERRFQAVALAAGGRG